MSRSDDDDDAPAAGAARSRAGQQGAGPDASPSGGGALVADVLPWDHYRRTRLPRGWAHPLGRDRIAAALRAAGATVGSLSLGRLDLPPRPGPQPVFDLLWLGDAPAGYGGTIEPGHSRLLMRWTAVPVEHRTEIVRRLEETVLAEGCRWAAASLSRGNAWSASQHRFLVTHVDGHLHVSES